MGTSKYDRQHTKMYHLKLNYTTDASLIYHLDHQPNVNGYLKSLIKNDMEDHNMKHYHIKPEHLSEYGDNATLSTVITEKELSDLANAWDKSVEDLLPDLIEFDDSFQIYRIEENSAEVDADEVEPGCTLDQRDQDPVIHAELLSKSEAHDFLKNYCGDINAFQVPTGWKASVTEYMITEYTVSIDGNETYTGVYEFGKMPEDFWAGDVKYSNYYSSRYVVIWYAYMRDAEDDDWGDGTFNRDEAIETVKAWKKDDPESYKDYWIAVIKDNHDPEMIDRIDVD